MVSIMKRIGLAAGLLAVGTALPPAAAQAPLQQFGAFRESPGSALNRHLRTLADQPRNLSALMGAGKAALELGDPQAALTFFARAEEIAPRDGRVKAGMGSAFIQMEQVQAALKFFSDAAALGVPEAEFAGDRGLAYDLTGDPRRAQADYALALRREDDAEVRRRLALSLAITGDRDRALATIDAQLRRQDRAAWRTRAFILALSGDSAEATRAAEAVMPAQAAQMRPFFASLPALSPAQRAMAVHFGHFPTNAPMVQPPAAGQQYASAAPVRPAPPASNVPATPRASQPARVESRQTNVLRRTPAAEQPAARRRTERELGRQPAPNALQERYGLAGRGRAAPTRRIDPQRPSVFAQAQPRTANAQPPRAAQSAAAAPPVAVTAPAPDQTRPSAASAQAVTPPVSQPAPAASAQAAPLPVAETAPAADALGAALAARPAPQANVATAGPAFSLPGADPAPAPSASVIAPITLPPSLRDAAAAAAEAPAPASPAAPSAAAASTRPAAPAFADIAAAIAALPAEAAPAAPARRPTALAQAEVRSTAPKPKTQPPAEEKAAPPKKEEPKKVERAKKPEPKKPEPAKQPAEAKKGATDRKAAPAKKAEAKDAPARKEPSRHWVQVAGGADKSALPREYARLQDKAPKLLAGRGAWTTPLRFTNRLLVGPFKSEKEAQAFVNELNKLDFSAFSWTSPAGQEIEKLPPK